MALSKHWGEQYQFFSSCTPFDLEYNQYRHGGRLAQVRALHAFPRQWASHVSFRTAGFRFRNLSFMQL
jgi:hypothetical protein